MEIKQEWLQYIYPHCPQPKIDVYLPLLNAYGVEASLSTPVRWQMFLAQVGHESAELRYVEELASGYAYEGRKDLGNVVSGDGMKYKGRGLIQITGRANYTKCGEDLSLPLVDFPVLLSHPDFAVRSAMWFWNKNKLNRFCDKEDFIGLTKAINGGTNGLAHRQELFNRAKEVVK